jgi:hypothetical protein
VTLSQLLARTEAGPGGCLLWRGRLDRYGYGVVTYRGSHRLAHRLAVELAGGDLSAGAVVGHQCDTRRCVNPQHLTVQSQSENRREAHARGRAHVQRLGGGAKRRGPLSVDQLCELRVEAAKGATAEELAEVFGCSVAHASSALRYGA